MPTTTEARQAVPAMPVHGQVITISKVPAGSYCRPDTPYRVERSVDRRTKQPKGDFRFVNVVTGGSTCDRAWAVRMATWSEAA